MAVDEVAEQIEDALVAVEQSVSQIRSVLAQLRAQYDQPPV